MENIRKNTRVIDNIDQDIALKVLEKERLRLEKEKEKLWKPPYKWQFKFMASKRASNSDKILVMMFNKKNQIEQPKFMPIYGNLIVWNQKVYIYRPKAIWTLMVMGKPQVYCIKEKDMEPISNISSKVLDEIMRTSGRITEYHKILLQAAIAAQTKKDGMKANGWIIAGVIIVVVGGLLWFFLKG